MLPKVLRQDIRLRTLSTLTTEEFNTLRSVIKYVNIMDIDNVHESFLPWLAWWFRVDAWDDNWSDERKRESISSALILRKYKGTIWAVEHALELSLFDATVVPWYAMLPEGERGTFRIDAVPSDSRSLTQSDYATFITLTESNKQASQHWTGNIKHDPSLGSAYAAPVIRTRKRWVSNSIVPLHVSSIVISPTDATVYYGETINVSATVAMSDGSTTHDVRFESSDSSIVTVDESGVVSYVATGSAIVYAISTYDESYRAECSITAKVKPVSVSISPLDESLDVGDSGTLQATVTFNDASEVSSIDEPSVVIWTSSDESKLTIDSNGNYVCISDGWVDVTATSSDDESVADVINILVGYELVYNITVEQYATAWGGYRNPDAMPDGSGVGGVDTTDWFDENGDVAAALHNFQYTRSATSDNSGFMRSYPIIQFRGYEALAIKIVSKTSGDEFIDPHIWDANEHGYYERPNDDNGDWFAIMKDGDEIEVWIKGTESTRHRFLNAFKNKIKRKAK